MMRANACEPENRLTDGVSGGETGIPDRSLVRSVAWSATGDWVSQIFTWLAFVVVMRLLTPADFGTAALAVLLLPYLQQITAFGIPRAVVTLRELTEDQLAQLNTVSFAFGLSLFGLAVLLAHPFAAFFNAPRVAPLLMVACLTLIPQGLQAVSSGSLAKQMRFRLLSILAAVNALVAAVVTLVLALLGFGYWSLVLGNLAGVTVRAVLVLWIRPCRLGMPRLSSIGETLRFCRHVVVSLLALNSYQRLDNFTAGKMLGQSALGFYGTAWDFANVPLEKVTSLVTNVIPTYLAAVRHDPVALRRYLRNLTETVALLTFPATTGLALVAPELVPLAFGHKWDGMIGPLEVLSFYAGFRSIVALLPKFLVAVGNTRYVMWNDLAALVILPVGFYIGAHRGTVGIAWSWVIAYPIVVLPLYYKTFETLEMKTAEYLRAVRPAVEATLATIIAVELVKYAMGSFNSLPLRLAIEVSTGVAAYVAVLGLRHRERLTALMQTVRSLRSPKPEPPHGSAARWQ
jgi:O-antigen/teichoic acid export membrane protein